MDICLVLQVMIIKCDSQQSYSVQSVQLCKFMSKILQQLITYQLRQHWMGANIV